MKANESHGKSMYNWRQKQLKVTKNWQISYFESEMLLMTSTTIDFNLLMPCKNERKWCYSPFVFKILRFCVLCWSSVSASSWRMNELFSARYCTTKVNRYDNSLCFDNKIIIVFVCFSKTAINFHLAFQGLRRPELKWFTESRTESWVKRENG